uniref:Uncharacterized protein n=1 Tax=Myoviridae sp. ctIty1 TaxID=2827673 RepID=A0A8S5THL6_9CAUD|nr:MAG TPA: hypothetical protein [Myoviridae sp. ctIty1]
MLGSKNKRQSNDCFFFFVNYDIFIYYNHDSILP